MKSKHYLLIATALVTVIFVAGNLLAQKVLTGVQIDFTQNHLYSLSKATKEKLSDIAEPVDVTLVYSRSVGQGLSGRACLCRPRAGIAESL